jgi:glycosyltransferase involved in cell wall biosynthesis
LDHPALLRMVARRARLTDAASHGEMTLAMLRLEQSRMGREMERLADWLAVERPDVLCLSNALQAGLIRPLKQRLGVRIICSFQGEDAFLDGLPEPFRRRCWRELAVRVREADALVAPSRFYAELMRQSLDPPPAAIEVIPNGIDPAHFLPPAPAEPPVIGYLARLCREKGLEIMVDAFIHLRQRLGHPSARLYLAGAATAADQPLMVGLQQRLKAAGLAGEVTWQPNLAGEEKPAMLASLSLFSVPALCPEAFGLYVVEALAAGVPVVQPAAAAFPELLDGVGRLVAPGDPATLAEAWQELLASPDELRRLAAASRAHAESRFAVERMAERFLALAASGEDKG